MFDYDEYAREAVTVLDKYDLREVIKWLIHCGTKDSYDIREAIGEHYKNECVGCEDVGEALENLSLDEFMEYLTVRYGIRWREDITYTYTAY